MKKFKGRDIFLDKIRVDKVLNGFTWDKNNYKHFDIFRLEKPIIGVRPPLTNSVRHFDIKFIHFKQVVLIFTLGVCFYLHLKQCIFYFIHLSSPIYDNSPIALITLLELHPTILSALILTICDVFSLPQGCIAIIGLENWKPLLANSSSFFRKHQYDPKYG